MYLSLKLHFTSDTFDYFKYGIAARASKQSFDVRKDKYFFVKLSRTFEKEELLDFFVASMITNDKIYPLHSYKMDLTIIKTISKENNH